MPHAKGMRILGHLRKIADKGIPEGIADLKRETQQHGINKEYEHLSPAKKYKGIQPERCKKRGFGPRPHRKAGRQRKRIDPKENPCRRAQIELVGTLFPPAEIHHPHRTDEAHRSPYPDRWKILHVIVSPPFQDNVRYRIVERNSRHKEKRIEKHRNVEHPIVMERGRPDEHAGADNMTDSQHPFGIQPPVRYDPEKRRSKDGRNAHGPINAPYLRTVEMKDIETISAQRDQPGTPYKEFQEVHYG